MNIMKGTNAVVDATNSVISWLRSESGTGVLGRYFSFLSGDDLPNYTQMLAVLGISSGTTADDIRLDSINVDRGRITSELRNIYKYS